MNPNTCRRIALAAAIGTAIAAPASAAGADRDAQQAMSDYGVTLALLGETAQAESVFVTLELRSGPPTSWEFDMCVAG